MFAGLLPVLFLYASGANGQTPSLTPTPDPMPVAPVFNSPVRPLPSAERVGVDLTNNLTLTLDEAIERALSNNNDIEASRKDARIAEFNFRAAEGVYDPQLFSENYFESLTTPTASAIGGAVNGSVTQTRFYGSGGVSGFSPFGGGSYSGLFNTSRTTTSNTNAFLNPQFPSSLGISYTQPLLRNFRIDNNRRQILIARKGVDLSEVQLRQRAIEIITGVEQAYWDLAFTLRNLQVQNDTLEQAREQLESNKRLVARGVLAPIELVAANAQILTFEQNVIIAHEAITRAENTLKTLVLPVHTSAEWSRPVTPVSPIELVPPQIGLEVAVAEAVKNRPELAQIDVTAQINEIDQRYFRDQTKPQIDLVGSYTSQSLAGSETAAAINPITGISRVPPNLVGGLPASLGGLFSGAYPSYRVGVNISLPWGNRIAKANLGRVIVEGERIGDVRAQAEQVIESEVRNALQALRSAEARLEAATAARVAAEELYPSEERQFRAGTTTFYLVLQRQTDLSAARGRELEARTALNKAISEFHRATGTTLSANNVTVSK